MNLFRWLIMLLLFSLIISQNIYSFEKQNDGIILKIKKIKDTDPGLIRIQICTDDIIRITASPVDSFSIRPSLIVNRTEWKPVKWSVKKNGSLITISTSKVIVSIDSISGRITFYDSDNHFLLDEKEGGGKIFTPAEVMGEKTYHIQQLFDSPGDEAFYGLGQHQNGVMNYKGHDVDLWQYNIIAVNPFLVSNKNYGILWDNNSRTKFGDIRNYQPINTLKLYNINGDSGGLTADYFKDTSFDDLFTSRIEQRIEHKFIDVNDEYPQGFSQNVSAVRWSGEIECSKPGIHKFRLYASGYIRMWLNNKLVVDSWRQNWLPWTHILKLNMESGKKYQIKIEWIHTGGYIGLDYLDPENGEDQNYSSLFSEVADQIDYYFIHGNDMDKLIHGYREITGKASMLPKWAMGFWQCRERYKTQDELLSVVKEFRKLQIPIDNIVQDWFYWKEDQWGSHQFDSVRYPDPDGMVKELHNDLHTHIMISVWPKFYVGIKHYDEFKEHGWLYMRNVEKGQRDWVGPGYVSTFYDPYSEGARELYWKQINADLFSKGFDAWWLDATEPDICSNLSREETRLRKIQLH